MTPPLRRFLSSKPAIAVFAVTVALILLGAGHHQGRHGTLIPGTSWDQTSIWKSATSGEGQDELFVKPKDLTLYNPRQPYNYMWLNEDKLRDLAACTASGSCRKNADKVGAMEVC